MVIIKESFVKFPVFEKFSDMMTHGFSTRIGGVSAPPFDTLNLGLKNRDDPENVKRNYSILLEYLKINERDLVFSNQVHGDSTEVVFERPASGKLENFCDALITNRPEIALTGFFADCVPVFLFDPEIKAAAIIHSGWKGTVLEITAKAIDKMCYLFKSNPSDIYAAIGPSIGKCCFETDNDVYMEFINRSDGSKKHIARRTNGKYHIDLKAIIEETLMSNGVGSKNIYMSPVCTKCSRDFFFSHRGDMGKTGSMVGIIQIK